MGFITYDLGDECQNFGKGVVDPEAVDPDSQATDTLIPVDNIDNNQGVDPDVFEELEKGDNDTGAIDDKEKVTNPNTTTTNRPDPDEEGGISIVTIAIYTGGVFCFVLIIFIVVMAVDKCRRSRKRITEVVEMKPVDLDAHRKGIAERNAQAVREKAKRNPIKPVMQPFDDGHTSSRGGTRYKSDEVDLSGTSRPLKGGDISTTKD